MMTIAERPSEPLARRDLWLSLAIGVTFACYHVVTAMTWSGPVETFRAYSLFSTGLTLVIFVLLWIGYRRWRDADRHRRELQSIMRSLTTEAIMVVDPGRRVQACNDAVQGLFGRVPEEVVGLLTDSLYEDRRADKSQPGEIWRALEQNGSHRGRARGRRRDNSTFDLEITTERFRGGSGAVLVLRDVTDRVRTENELREANVRVEESYLRLKEMEEMRDNLTHMVIHDMRTPLQVILTMSEMLGRDLPGLTAGGEAAAMLEGIRQQGRVLARMADNILDVSRLEHGRMPLACSAQDLRRLVGSVCEDLASLLAEHEVVHEAASGPLRAWCDPDVVGRVVANLVANAGKYTPPGGRIVLALSGTGDHVRVEVRDNGPGLPPEMHGLVFEKYARADVPVARRQHSTGLGLTFCKLAVESHGGAIGVESAPGQGSCFWFTLPREDAVVDLAPAK